MEMTDNNQARVPPGELGIDAREISQRSVFLLALIPGAIAIAISRYLQFSGLSFLLAGIAIPVACMLTYWAVNVRGEFFDSTRAQVADNIYFLGFLYFLVSLSGTLLLFAASKQVDQTVVVQGFGIALVTTILGLFLRILVLQQAAPFEEARERAEQDLLQEIIDSRAQIAAGNEALRQAQDVAISGLAETTRVLAEKAAATADEMTMKVVTAATAIEERLRHLDIPADTLTRAFQPAIEELRGAVSDFAQSTKEQAQAGRDLAAKVRGLAAPLEKTAAALKSLNRTVELVRPGVEAIEQSITASAAGTAAVAKSTDAVAKAADVARDSMQALAGSVAALQERVQTLSLGAGLEQTAAQLKQMQDQLAALSRLATDTMPVIGQGFGDLPVLAEKLKGIADDIRQATSATRTMVSELERIQGPEAIRGALDSANSVVSNLRELQAIVASQIER
ncbi:MAG: hypothetical protein HY661_04810, partial [Betaproteobacteria bacterium]|nr:hypothetical protein [Betaproteobacteria bacterium]